MEKNKNVKDITIDEASGFWDENDFGEFDDVHEVNKIQFSLRKKEYVRIDNELYARIKRKAETLKKSEDVLINKWLSEKVTI